MGVKNYAMDVNDARNELFSPWKLYGVWYTDYLVIDVSIMWHLVYADMVLWVKVIYFLLFHIFKLFPTTMFSKMKYQILV